MSDESRSFCDNCGQSVPLGSKFCSACGTPLETIVAPQEAEQSLPAPKPALPTRRIFPVVIGVGVVIVLIVGWVLTVGSGPTVAETPIGDIRLLPRPGPNDCPALETFRFNDIVGLDTSEWDNRDMAVKVSGLETSTLSIDLQFSSTLGLYIIRDGELVANLRPGSRSDDAQTRRYYDTWFALHWDRPNEGPDDPVPTLNVGGGATGGGIRTSRVPQVANCSFNQGIQTTDESIGD